MKNDNLPEVFISRLFNGRCCIVSREKDQDRRYVSQEYSSEQDARAAMVGMPKRMRESEWIQLLPGSSIWHRKDEHGRLSGDRIEGYVSIDQRDYGIAVHSMQNPTIRDFDLEVLLANRATPSACIASPTGRAVRR